MIRDTGVLGLAMLVTSRSRGVVAPEARFVGHRLAVYWCVAFVLLLTTSCATTNGRSRLHPYGAPPGSLMVAQVVMRLTREAILQDQQAIQILRASGIGETEIHDGSLALGRINCCGNAPTEARTAVVFYVGSDVTPELGDVVEIKLGRSPQGPGDLGEANRATRIVQKAARREGRCRWEPPEPRLWGRVLYCDWMPAQGWVKEGPAGSIYRSWIRKP
jgi:hypothetical protein